MRKIDLKGNAHRFATGDTVSETDANVFEFPVSSRAPAPMYTYEHGRVMEVLSHDKSAVDLDFLNSGNAPLLDSHRTGTVGSQMGIIQRAWLHDNRLYVSVRIGGSPQADQLAESVRAGMIRNVSIGYRIKKYEYEKESKTLTVTRWWPYEASFVTVPADTSVGVGRSDRGVIMEDELPEVSDENSRAQELETSINEITALAETHNMGDVARSFIKGQLEQGSIPSLALFRGVVRSKLPSGTPLVNTDIGLTEDETRSFSILRVANALESNNWREAEFERECFEATSERARNGGFVVPSEVLSSWLTGSRASMTTANPASVSNIQTVDHRAESFIEALYNTSAIIGAGASVLDGLDSNVEIPGADGVVTATWLASEDADAAESNPTFRKVTMAPKDVACYTDISRRLMQQATISVENLIRRQMTESLRVVIDAAALYGTGASGIPRGVANTVGIGSVTFGAATPTRGEIIDLRTAIASTNRGRGVTYIGNSDMVGRLQKVTVDAGSGVFLMGDDASRLVGNPFNESNQVLDSNLFSGVWQDLIVGMWDGIEIARSTERKFLSGGVTLRVIQTVDFGVLRVGSFALGAPA